MAGCLPEDAGEPVKELPRGGVVLGESEMAEGAFEPRRGINIHAHIKRGEDVHQNVAVWKAQGAIRTCVQSLAYSDSRHIVAASPVI